MFNYNSIYKKLIKIFLPVITGVFFIAGLFYYLPAMKKAEAAARKNAPVFYDEPISKNLYKRIYKKSYKKNCPVSLKQLRHVVVYYYGFDNKSHKGELIVNKAIAKDTIEIFEKLYKNKYPIEKIKLIDCYNAEDNKSMADNNSSSFNFRYIDGTKKYSNHAKGLAIDINPLYNPYIVNRSGKKVILPKESKPYADRTKKFPYKMDTDDYCVKLFKEYGFTWGGDWKHSKDYQHFEKTKF